jgi:putative membrane protein
LVTVKSEKVRSPFAPDQHERVDAAMAAIEHDTSADLCVVVTRVSDRYALYPVAWAAIAAILLGVLVSLIRPEIASRTTILIQLTFAIVLTLIFDWLPIRLSIVPKRVKHAHAWQLAHREFNAHAMANPKQ